REAPRRAPPLSPATGPSARRDRPRAAAGRRPRRAAGPCRAAVGVGPRAAQPVPLPATPPAIRVSQATPAPCWHPGCGADVHASEQEQVVQSPTQRGRGYLTGAWTNRGPFLNAARLPA